MRGSSQKDLAVFDFSEEEAAVEAASERFAAKLQSRVRPKMDDAVTKYHFLEAFASGLPLKGDVTDVLCMDTHERGNDRDSDAIDVPEQGLSLSDEKADLDEIMASSTSYDGHGQMHPDEFEDGTLRQKDNEAVGTSSVDVLPLPMGNKPFLDLPSDGMTVDVISEDEESWSMMSGSESRTASDTAEDEGCSECPELENCYAGIGDVLNNQMAVIITPDYVIHGSTLYGESQLVFSADCVKIECSDAIGKDEKFASEWAVADIVHIHCRWSGSVTTASVKLCLRANDVTKNEKRHNDSGVLKVIFSVNDMHWLEKEQKIRNLAARYKDIWNANSGDMLWEDDSQGPNAFFSRGYFTEIADSFEDVVYPKGDPDAVSISKSDIDLLQPETFINDTIIDFYIKYLKNKIQPDQKHRFHFFNSFFFRKLADLDKDRDSVSEGRAAFLRVRKWTRKVNIFEKDYIFIPVNYNLHWSLLVVCHPGEVANLKADGVYSVKVPCILHMDSIKGSHRGLKNIIQSYIWEEWKERHPETTEDDSLKFLNLRFVSLELPQQENSFDCGLFLLHYVELFLEEAPVNFDPFKITKFSSFLSADWFPPSEASLKRSLIWKLIYELLNEPSQKINPRTCSNGHPSATGYPEENIEQEQHIELLSSVHCSPYKGMGHALCPDSEDGTEIELLPSSCGTQCDKQAALMLSEFLEPGANTIPLPEHGQNVHQHDATSPKLLFVSCSIVEQADGRKRLSSLSLEKEDCQQFDGSLNAQFCTSSSTNVVGACTISLSTVDGGDADVDLTPECMNANSMNANRICEAEKMGLASSDNFDYVPETPTSSSREKLDDFVEDSQEADISKAKGKDTEDSPRNCIRQTDCEIVDGTEINTIASEVGDVTGCQVLKGKDSEDSLRNCIREADCEIVDGRGINTNASEVGDVTDCQVLNATRAGDADDDCLELVTNEAGCEDGEDCQELVTNASEVGVVTDCQVLYATRAGDGDDDCLELVTNDAGCEDGEDCQETSSASVRQDDDGHDTHIMEDNRGDGNCQENNNSSSFQGIIVADDESLDKDDVQVMCRMPVQQPHKRRKVMIPEGTRTRTRMGTRSFTREP